MFDRRYVEWVVTALMFVVIAVVFHQIYTTMMDAGIAKGGPYENAAAYPRAIAIIIGILLIIERLVRIIGTDPQRSGSRTLSLSQMKRPILLIIVLAAYLWALESLGYHLSTIPFLFLTMTVCGERKWLRMILVSIIIAFFMAFLFEVPLKIVLPGGFFQLNIPW